uniref:LOB domain-containing protein n=1 Tax=Ananas comosus var. bracteatus TaxID=296719 RepID=A0A6V7PDC5_ANACO|nr:unnamed protein product [Ananas comosus var. bracteatus]
MHKGLHLCPFLPSEDPHKFAIVHKVFGASNVSKMLQVHHIIPSLSAPESRCSEQLSLRGECKDEGPGIRVRGGDLVPTNQVSQLQMQLAVAQAEILCIQMQQEPPLMADHQQQIDSDDKSNYLMHNSNVISGMPSLMNFASPSNNVATQEPLKRESLWT